MILTKTSQPGLTETRITIIDIQTEHLPQAHIDKMKGPTLDITAPLHLEKEIITNKIQNHILHHLEIVAIHLLISNQFKKVRQWQCASIKI